MAAGYSGTPLPTKLGIREGHRVALVHAPTGYPRVLGQLPPDVELRRDLRGRTPFDVLLGFFTRRQMLEREFDRLASRLTPAGGLWVAWPKKASGKSTDLADGVVREIGLAGGLVDNKVCAIDEVWSGLRFVVRLRDRR
jgi:hypothetical protein